MAAARSSEEALIIRCGAKGHSQWLDKRKRTLGYSFVHLGSIHGLMDRYPHIFERTEMEQKAIDGTPYEGKLSRTV